MLVLLWAAPAHAQGTTTQALAIGDSITMGYGPTFVKKFGRAGWAWIGTAGSVACDAWADRITDFPKSRLDFEVIEDYAPGGAPCTDKAAYRAAMQDVRQERREPARLAHRLMGVHRASSVVDEARSEPPAGQHCVRPTVEVYV